MEISFKNESKEAFEPYKIEKIHHQQTHTKRNVKGSPSGTREMILDLKKWFAKRMKLIGNDNSVSKY